MNTSGFEHGYGLFVGVGRDLPVTEIDAKTVADLFMDENRCGYSRDNVRLLTGAKATRENILAGLDWLSTCATQDPDATIVFYFSGHGGTRGTNHLAPFDYNPLLLAETSVSGAELTEKIRQVDSKKVLLLLDCCHAGGMAEIKDAAFKHTPYPAELRSILQEGQGRFLLASSRADEVSYTAKPYSQFTMALLEGLSGYGASRQDGYARIADVALYVAYKVITRTDERQHPILDLSQADNFVVAYYAGGEKKPRQLAGLPEDPIPFDPNDERYAGEYRALMRNFMDFQMRLFNYDSQTHTPATMQMELLRILKKIGNLETTIREKADIAVGSHNTANASGAGALAINSGRDTNINNIHIEGGFPGNFVIGGNQDSEGDWSQEKSYRPPGDSTTDAPPPPPLPEKDK